MKINNRLLSRAFVIGLGAIVVISLIGIIGMSRSRVVLQGEVNEVRHQFKKHIYAVNVRNGVVLPELELFTLEPDEVQRPGDDSTYIRLRKGVNVKDVISCLNDKYELTGFHEILPSMHEVFIEAVNGKDKI